MLLNALKAGIPDYAKDIRLNLDSVLAETGATLCAATNGVPSTDNTTSRVHTGARGETPSARCSSAHGNATASHVTRTATVPSVRKCAVSEPPPL